MVGYAHLVSSIQLAIIFQKFVDLLLFLLILERVLLAMLSFHRLAQNDFLLFNLAARS